MIRIFVLAAMLLLTVPAVAAEAPPADKPASFSDAPPPPAAAPAEKEIPRNDQPMEDFTKYYAHKEFTTDGAGRHAMTYFWRQPKLEADKTYPLVIVLHDENGFAPAAEMLITPDIQNANPSFIAVPMLATKKIWAFPEKFPDDPPMATKFAGMPQGLPDAMQLIAELRKTFPVDEKRIYIVGCGDGGWGAFGAVAQNPNLFAAAIPMAGGWTQADAGKLKKTPIYAVHGADDKVYEAALDQMVAVVVQKVSAMKAPIFYLMIPGLGHDCKDSRFYPKALWKWMYSQHKP